MALDVPRLRSTLQAALEESGAPSLAVGVACDGEIVWEEVLGPGDEHTPYSIASITKPFTGTALMQAVERGDVDLDAPVDRYLGGARLRDHVPGTATVRHVANHTAGLPLHYQFFYADEPAQPPPFADTLRRYGLRITAPGERQQYSNLGYGVLGHLIATTTGRPFADVLRDDVFAPLGMRDSALCPPTTARPDAAPRLGTDGVAYPMYDFDHRGGSAVYASVHDLLRFALWNLGTPLADQTPVLGDDARATMHAPSSHGDVGGYGVGWVTGEECGYATLGHSGGMGGVSTQLTLVPSAGVAVVALVNQTGSLLAARTRVALLGALLPGYEPAAVFDALVADRLGVPGEKLTGEQWAAIGGRWQGEIDVDGSPVPITVDADATAQLLVTRVGSTPRVIVDRLRIDRGRLHGAMQGTIVSPDTDRYRHGLLVDLRHDGDVIDGAIIATALPGQVPEGGAPGRRAGSALAHWVSLQRR